LRKTLNFVLAIFFISNFSIVIDSHAKDFLKEIERSGGTTEQEQQRDFDMGEERIGDKHVSIISISLRNSCDSSFFSHW